MWAVVPAVATAIVVLFEHQPAGVAFRDGLIVGLASFLVVFGVNLLRAPRELGKLRNERLAAWRERFAFALEDGVLRVYVDLFQDLDGVSCVVERDGQRWRAPVEAKALPFAVMSGGETKAIKEWNIPGSFPGMPMKAGTYTVRVEMGSHVEPIAMVPVEVSKA